MKTCSKCKREFPASEIYFNKDKYRPDGLTSQCRECRVNKRIFDVVKEVLPDGYKKCIKCERLLLIDIRFFPPDKMCKIDGLRNVCRECGKDGHFMEEGYVPKKWWTEEEDEFFISVYPNYTNEELIKLFYQDCTAKDLWDKAYRLGIMGKSNEAIERANKQRSEKMSGENAPWYGKQRSEDTRRKISIAKKGKYVGINNKLYGIAKTDEHRKNLSIAKAKLGRWKGNKNPRHITPLIGELNGRWEGGITAENRKIRNSDEYKDWRNNVFDRDNYTCQCCGEKSGDLEAHHIENFSSNEDKRFDVNNGITMCRKCHNPVEYNSFHYIYGTRNNTKEQLEEYIARYKSGEFRDSGVTVSIVV